jgi:hypothetical protein
VQYAGMRDPRASCGLSHVAMSVPVGTLTEQFRSDVLVFYGEHFGWTEIESLRRPDRMTIAIGGDDYLNVRERERALAYEGYEHFGLRLPAPDAVEDAWTAIAADGRDVELEPIQRGADGYRQFRVRYLLPMTVEVQHLPGSGAAS